MNESRTLAGDNLAPGNHSPIVFWSAMVVFAFIVAPLLIVIVISFTSSNYITFPPESLSLKWYRMVLTDDGWVTPLKNSIIVGALVAVFSTICGTCGAIALNQGRFRFKLAAYTFMIAPMMVPRIIIAIAIFNVFLLLKLTGSFLGIALALTTITIPYTVITITASFSNLDVSITEAARVHGASRFQTFRHVILPTILPGMISGGVFSFIMAWNDYIIAVYVSGTKGLLPITIFQSLRYRVSPGIAAVGGIIILTSLTMTVLVFVFDNRY